MSSEPGPVSTTVFVCYARKDNESSDPTKRWLDRLLEHLKPLVLQKQLSIWSDKELEGGNLWDESIQTTLQNASAAVLLVSSAFLASEYIRNSELPVLLKRAKEKGLVILPIILRPCLLNETKFKYPDPVNGPEELSLASLQAANSPTEPLNGLSESEQDEVLLSVAQRLLKILEQKRLKDSSGKAGAIKKLPFERNPFFTGRDKILEDLHTALKKNSATAQAQTQVISGLGGVGKSQTAIEYAYRFRDEYKAVFWVGADTHLALTTGFVEIARALNLPEKDAQNPDEAVRAGLRWLEDNSDWLLIFDNADTPELLKGFRPHNPEGHILLTSRAPVFDTLGIAKPVEMEAMLPDEALKFLFARTGRSIYHGEESALSRLPHQLSQTALEVVRRGQAGNR